MKYHDVVDTMADHPEKVMNMKNQARLMDEIRKRIDEEGWTQAEAAKHLGINEQELSYLYRGHQSKFSLEELLNMPAALKG